MKVRFTPSSHESKAVVHVWAPGLEVQRKFDGRFPVIAIRKSIESPEFCLVDKIEGITADLENMVVALSGTGGRAKCLITTSLPFFVLWEPKSTRQAARVYSWKAGPTVWYDATKLTADQIVTAVLGRTKLPKELVKEKTP